MGSLNASKTANALGLHRAFRKAIAWSRRDEAGRGAFPILRQAPMSLSVEPTTACNLRCPECPSGLRSFTRPTGMLDPDRLHALLEGREGLGRDLVYLNLYFQGEPYLNPGMDELVRTGKQAGLYVSTSTNAHHIDAERARRIVDSGIDRLIISIDGADQEAYAAYRVGGRLERVLEATRHLVEARKEARRKGPHLVWQFLVVGTNEHQLPTMRDMARRWGVDEFVVKTAQLDDPRDGHPLLTGDPALRRYDRDPSGRWTLRNPMLDRCWRMWQGAVVTWDGQVVPCCFDKDAAHGMGRAEDGTGFREIWTSPAYQDFRQQIFRHRAGVEMCRNCTEGTKVWA